jgi:hypothetical protein
MSAGMDNQREYTSQERAALITVRLLRGEQLTNQQVARICGYASRNSAYGLMMRLSRVLPICFVAGCWKFDGNCPARS